MVEFSFKGWKFFVDQEKTKEFYKSVPIETNEICLYLNKESDFTELISFLSVDIRKPIEISKDKSEAIFLIYGKAISADGYEIDFMINQHFITIIVFPEDNCGLNTNEDVVFSIAIQNYLGLIMP